MKLSKCLELQAKMHSYFKIFIINTDSFYEEKHHEEVHISRRKTYASYDFLNVFLHQKYSNYMFLDAVFDGDYESSIIFSENIRIKDTNLETRMHFGL